MKRILTLISKGNLALYRRLRSTIKVEGCSCFILEKLEERASFIEVEDRRVAT